MVFVYNIDNLVLLCEPLYIIFRICTLSILHPKSPILMFWCVHDVIVLTYSYNGLAEKWICMLHDNPFCLLFSVQVSINIPKCPQQSSAL